MDSRSEDAGSQSGRAHTSIVLRVPAAKLDGVVRELKSLGAVQTADTTAEDVTAQPVDLDARIKALQTSVDRLLAINCHVKDPTCSIKAEDALSQRQADLDSLRVQRRSSSVIRSTTARSPSPLPGRPARWPRAKSSTRDSVGLRSNGVGMPSCRWSATPSCCLVYFCRG